MKGREVTEATEAIEATEATEATEVTNVTDVRAPSRPAWARAGLSEFGSDEREPEPPRGDTAECVFYSR